jgi:DNA-directed RNA polymerase subunit K/omega
MVMRPDHLSAYEFVVICALRAKQLLTGCTPRLAGDHNAPTMAQMEVAAGCILRADAAIAESLPTASSTLQ